MTQADPQTLTPTAPPEAGPTPRAEDGSKRHILLIFAGLMVTMLLASLDQTIFSTALFGALAYLPTYLQMVTGVNATQAGLLMIPMMAALLISSVGSGQLVSRTGR